ncbi:MAG TPA: YciI family protein [Baekduia sp.]
MPIYALLVEFRGGPPSEVVLEAHRNWLLPKFAQGEFVLSGSLDAVPGRPASALGFVSADSLEDAKAIVADDPFIEAGLCAHEVVPFTPRVKAGDLDAFFDGDAKVIALAR